MTGLEDHYGQSGLVERINRQLTATGIGLDEVELRHLSGVDEFHLGGGAATVALLEDLALTEDARVLDVGCGIGGAARRMADGTQRLVTGVDMVPNFVELANHLSALTGLAGQTSFSVGDATALDIDDATFDAVTMFHVGMNVDDKPALVRELRRVVRDDGLIAIYDIMRVGDGEIDFPVPWSSHPATSFLSTPAVYLRALEDAGVRPDPPVNRAELARDAMSTAAADPPPMNLSHLMGPTWPAMFTNLRAALGAGVVAPIQIVGRCH